MKRYALLTLLCIGILSTGAIVYAGLVQADGTSMLSDQEMAQITGSCACYADGWHTDCRWYGDLECTIGDTCEEEDAYKISQAYLYQVTTSGTPNGKWPDYIWVPCYTLYSVKEVGEHHPYFCNTVPPPYDEEEYSGYWYSCKWDISEWCLVCEWDEQLESSYMYKSWYCKSNNP